jgi:hypothetical protein
MRMHPGQSCPNSPFYTELVLGRLPDETFWVEIVDELVT